MSVTVRRIRGVSRENCTRLLQPCTTSDAGSDCYRWASSDRCHTCDFIARFCRTSARLYRATKSQTVELHDATLSHKQTRLLHPFHDPPSQTQFQNDEIIPYLIFFWTLRLVVRFRFVRQPAETRLLPRISVISLAGLVCLRDKVTECNCTVARCHFIARWSLTCDVGLNFSPCLYFDSEARHVSAHSVLSDRSPVQAYRRMCRRRPVRRQLEMLF